MTKNDKLRHHKRRVNVHQIFFLLFFIFLFVFYFFICFLFFYFLFFYFFGNLEQIRQHPN